MTNERNHTGFYKSLGSGSLPVEYLLNERHIMGGCIVISDGVPRYHFLLSLIPPSFVYSTTNPAFVQRDPVRRLRID